MRLDPAVSVAEPREKELAQRRACRRGIRIARGAQSRYGVTCGAVQCAC